MTSKEKRSKIPYIFFGFFAVVIAVNVFYVYLSKKTWRGIVTGDSYYKGLNYNDNIEQAKKQKELGWQMEVKYRRLGVLKGVITLDLQDKNGLRVDNANIYITFKRPTQEGFDFVQNVDTSTGIYKSEVTFPLAGQWDVEIVASKDGNVFQEVKRYVIE